MASEMPLPQQLRDEILATVAVTNNIAFDAVRGALPPPPKEPRFTSEVRAAFSRGYKLAADLNHPRLDVDHVIIGFLNTLECQEELRRLQIDTDATYARSMARLRQRREETKLLTPEFLTMSAILDRWLTAGLKQTGTRPKENRHLETKDMFNAVLDAVDLRGDELASVREQIVRLSGPWPKPLHEILEIEAKEIKGRTERIIMDVEKVGKQVAAVHVDLRQHRAESVKNHQYTHAQTKDIDERTKNIEKLLAPVSLMGVAGVLSFAIALGIVGGWVVRYGGLL